MSTLRAVLSRIGGARVLGALAALYLVVGVLQVWEDLVTGGPPSEVLTDIVLFGVLSGTLFYGALWLRRSDIDPSLCPRIVGWSLSGVAVMFGVFLTFTFNPDVLHTEPLRAVGVNTAIGANAGFGVGVMEARALTRAAVAEDREESLRESKRELRTLIDLLPVAVFVAEADGSIVEWNQTAVDIWGGEVIESDSIAEYEEYDGWWVDSGERVEPQEWPLARALQGEEVTDPAEITIEGFDGKRRTVLNHGMPVRDDDGEVSRAVVTLVDITERKEYQRRLEASNERLEQFGYAASHDLQEPLRMVSTYLQLLEQRYGDELDEDGQEYLGFAVDGADRMRDMIEGLLEYSRVETGGEAFEPVDLDDVLEAVLDDLQVRIAESDARITADTLPTVHGDRGQLHQVLQNLLSNAIEYSEGSPTVHVGARRRGDEWVLSVEDDGVGIDPEYADRIFEVFQRLESHGDHSGTGIGLALCDRIVERHGGDIWVESTPGDGSTFYVSLPAAGTSAPGSDSAAGAGLLGSSAE